LSIDWNSFFKSQLLQNKYKINDHLVRVKMRKNGTIFKTFVYSSALELFPTLFVAE